MLTVGESAPYPPLVAAAMRERLHVGADDVRITHVLYAATESASGESISSRALFRPSRIDYLGGLQLSFLLHDVATNATTKAGTESLLGTVKYQLGKGSAGPLKVQWTTEAEPQAGGGG